MKKLILILPFLLLPACTQETRNEVKEGFKRAATAAEEKFPGVVKEVVNNPTPGGAAGALTSYLGEIIAAGFGLREANNIRKRRRKRKDEPAPAPTPAPAAPPPVTP